MSLLSYVLFQCANRNIVPFAGIEAEFSIIPPPDTQEIALLTKHIHTAHECTLVAEKFPGHYEIIAPYSRNISTVCNHLNDAIYTIKTWATTHEADFSQAAISPDGKAQGLHFHVHAEYDGGNIFACPLNGEGNLLRVAGVMLELAPACMTVFAPHEHDYMRYRLHSPLSPSRLCIGKDNRSAALRIPPCHSGRHKRIEHRISAAGADITDCTALILSAFLYKNNQPQTISYLWGNAFDSIYDGIYSDIPLSLTEAKHAAHPYIFHLYEKYSQQF